MGRAALFAIITVWGAYVGRGVFPTLWRQSSSKPWALETLAKKLYMGRKVLVD